MKIKKVTAQDIMSEIVVSVPEQTPIKDAVHLMLRERINGLPVIDQHKKITGILTLTDFFKLVDNVMTDEDSDFMKEILECVSYKAADIMTREVILITPKTTIEEIIRYIMDRKIHTFPVVDHDKLVGIVGRHDVLNAVFAYIQR